MGRTGEYIAFNNGIHLYFEYGDNLRSDGCTEHALIYYHETKAVYKDVFELIVF
jgi:hypothetical protein